MTSSPEQTNVPPHRFRWLTGTEFEIAIEHGELSGTYSQAEGLFLLSDTNVRHNFRKEGKATQLFRIAEQKAIELGATAIVAALVTREVVATAITVFGEAAVSVEALGQFDQQRLPPHRRHETRAWLHYPLDAG